MKLKMKRNESSSECGQPNKLTFTVHLDTAGPGHKSIKSFTLRELQKKQYPQRTQIQLRKGNGGNNG